MASASLSPTVKGSAVESDRALVMLFALRERPLSDKALDAVVETAARNEFLNDLTMDKKLLDRMLQVTTKTVVLDPVDKCTIYSISNIGVSFLKRLEEESNEREPASISDIVQATRRAMGELEHRNFNDLTLGLDAQKYNPRSHSHEMLKLLVILETQPTNLARLHHLNNGNLAWELAELTDKGFVEFSAYSPFGSPVFSITDQGRRYLARIGQFIDGYDKVVDALRETVAKELKPSDLAIRNSGT